jgi:hypothetical protein
MQFSFVTVDDIGTVTMDCPRCDSTLVWRSGWSRYRKFETKRLAPSCNVCKMLCDEAYRKHPNSRITAESVANATLETLNAI